MPDKVEKVNFGQIGPPPNKNLIVLYQAYASNIISISKA